jgi:hypothetical protein
MFDAQALAADVHILRGSTKDDLCGVAGHRRAALVRSTAPEDRPARDVGSRRECW